MIAWDKKRTARIALITLLVSAAVVVIAANFWTPEKQIATRIEHTAAIKDDQFRHEMAVMLGPDIVAGNRITVLENGVEIFPALLDAISKAEKSINFETYIYWSGKIGAQIADALSERARAGIAVNVMIDWAGSIQMDEALFDGMKSAGVVIHRYRPLRWYNLNRMNNRTHRKLLVIDGRVGFTGGVGIADQWQGNAEDPDQRPNPIAIPCGRSGHSVKIRRVRVDTD